MTTSTMSIADSVKSAFPFNVDKFPLYGPDNMPTGVYGLFRDNVPKHETGFVGSGSVTSRYVPHTTDDVIALCEAASTIFDENVNIRCHWNEGHHVIIAPNDNHRRAIYSTDTVWPKIIINFGYDMTACESSIAMFRDMCLNLHRTKRIEGANTTIRHTSGLRPKMDELIAQFGELKNGWEAFMAFARQMQDRNVFIADFLNHVYPEPTATEGREVTIHKNRTAAIVERIMRERNKLGLGNSREVTVWQAFNGVQGYVQHDATRKGGNRNDFDRLMLAHSDASVLKAEKFALSLVG